MGNHSINDLAFLNQKIEENEGLKVSLSKAIALMRFALDGQLLRQSKIIAELNLWVLLDILDESKRLNSQILQSLKEMRRSKRKQ